MPPSGAGRRKDEGMNILVVSSAVPYPLIDGGSRGVFFPIKTLAERGHRIHLACLARKADEEAVRELSRYCTVDLVPCVTPPEPLAALASLFSATPYALRRFHHGQLLERIRERLSASSFDVLQVEGAHEIWYGVKLRKEFNIPTVIRAHSLQHMNVLRLARSCSNPALRLFLLIDGWKARRYEARESGKVDLNMVVSDTDGRILHDLNPSLKCMTVPAGVDLQEFTPADEPGEPDSVLWMGSLGWPPNQDSFRWFTRQILPQIVRRIPAVRVRVVGSNAPPDILAVRDPNLTVVGFVPDMREELRRAQVCVVPLQAGSGIRIKLLEMFAMARAVVSTSIGCEGLGVEDGKQLLIADTPASFADAVARLLRDAGLRAALGANALAHVRERYGWEAIASVYEEAYRVAIRTHGGE